MSKTLVNFLKFLLFLSIGTTILYLVYRGENAKFLALCLEKGIPEDECSLIDKIINDFKNAKFFWIFVVIMAFMISNISRAIRWKMLLRPLGFNPRFINCFLTTFIMYFTNLGLPRVGEFVRAGMMTEYEDIPMEKAMGTVVVDRMMDVLCLLIIISLAFLLEFDTLWNYLSEYADLSKFLNYKLFGGLAIIVIALISIWLKFKDKWQQTAVYKKVSNILTGFWEGIQTIRRLERPWLFIFHSIVIWVMYYFMTYLFFFAFEPTSHLGPQAGLIVFVFGAFGIVIPSPGGMGTYQFLVKEILLIYGIDTNDGFSFANMVFFSIQIGVNVIVGILAYILLPIINRNYTPKPLEHAATDSI